MKCINGGGKKDNSSLCFLINSRSFEDNAIKGDNSVIVIKSVLKVIVQTGIYWSVVSGIRKNIAWSMNKKNETGVFSQSDISSLVL